MAPAATPTRPYLIRALYEWICDNGLTPHIVVDATAPGLKVPPDQARDGRRVLNISPSATRQLTLGNDVLAFEARFGGVPIRLEIPPLAVLGIYARETGQGMVFTDEQAPPEGPTTGGTASDHEGTSRPRLKIVK
jgi:stringent starvation protein B